MEDNIDNSFRILIVDDSKITHQIFHKLLDLQSKREILKNMHDSNQQPIRFPSFIIDSAYQGEDAVALVEKSVNENKPYALAFIDIRMPPGWDGLETIKRIWSLDKNIQVVICTAFSDYSWEETVIGLSAFDNFLILKKPFDSMTVRQLACSLTRKWQLSKDALAHTRLLEREVKERTRELLHKATHDPLTNLPDRFLLTEQLKHSILENRYEDKVAIFLLDIDRFKLINDSMTHSLGDELLKQLAVRLKKLCVKNKNFLARLGGDEFVIVSTELHSLDAINEYAKTITKEINKPFKLNDQELRITTSIGISVSPTDSTNAEVLLRNADIAMYKAKEMGPNNFQLYSEKIDVYSKERLNLQNELMTSLEKNQLILYYQPEFSLATHRIKAVEGLIRWKHPQKGMIPPLEFIGLAEETGFIVPLGEWVLRTACKQNKIWQEKGLPRMRVAVNVAAGQFEQSNFVELVKSILEETELNPQYLELELTENIVIGNGKIIENIRALKAVGVQIALDDFGTGYSNLHYLKQLPIDRIKIDKGYVQNIHVNSNDEAIIRAVIAMASSLNLQVLAEGVETIEQLKFLREENCDEGQGYYFSRPLPPDALEKFLITYQKAFQNKT